MVTRCFRVVFVTLLWLLLCFPDLAWASAQGGSKGGVMDVHWGLAFWTLITFFVLLLVLKQFAWKPLLQALDEREKHIREALETAEKSRQEAQQALQQAQQKLAASANEAHAILEHAKQQAAKLRDEMTVEAEKECNRLKAQAEIQIVQAKDKALQEIWSHITLISTEIAGKLLRKTIDPQEHKQLLEQSLDDVRKHLQN